MGNSPERSDPGTALKIYRILEIIYLTLIAYATNMGLAKMTSCSNLSYHQLKKTSGAFFRQDTLKVANELGIKFPNVHQIEPLSYLDMLALLSYC